MNKPLKVVLSVMLLGGLLVVANELWVIRCQGVLSDCCANLKNLQNSIEQFKDTHGGHPPKALAEVTVPACPAAGKDTYSASYQGHDNGRYTLYCQGTHHAGVYTDVPDYPRVDLKAGILIGPDLK